MKTKKLFGTNGIRFVVDESLDPNFILDCALAIGTYFKKERVAMGMDTRGSGEFVKSGLLAGLTSCGCEVLDLGMVPTPCLQIAAKRNGMFGIIITASHNPPEFNGIKCIDKMGMELSQKSEKEIEKIFWGRRFKTADWRHIEGTKNADFIPDYVESILTKVDVRSIAKSKLKVAVDCANGCGSLTTPQLLERLGCEVVTLNCHPSSEPARSYEPTIENLEGLMTLTKSANADVGIAHDGDADRTIFVDENGNYVYGDRTLALMAKHMLRTKKGLVVTPVSSSQCIEDVVSKAGGRIHYTKVGAPIVARTMFEKRAVFGGEENGGMIFPEHLLSRDGGMTVAKMVEIMAKGKKKLSALLQEVPFYEQYKTKTECPDETKAGAIRKLATKLKREKRKISMVDGIKLFDTRGWVLIRASGTEPIIRIFAEGKSRKSAKELADEGKALIKRYI